MPKYVSNGGDWKEVNKPVEITVEDKPVVEVVKEVVVEKVVEEEIKKVVKKRKYTRRKK